MAADRRTAEATDHHGDLAPPLAQDLELRGVRLRDVYRDKDGELWEVVSLCDQPIAGFRRVKDGQQVDHVIGCLNMKMQFPKGGVRV